MTEDDYKGIVDPNEQKQYFLFEEEDGTKVCLKEFFPKVTTVDGKKVLAKGTGITYKAKIPADVLGDRKNVTVYAVDCEKFNANPERYMIDHSEIPNI